MDIHELYSTNKELKKSDIKLLGKWMETQPHLPKFDERMIIILFQACDLSLERTKKCIEYYYTIRTSFPAMFSDRDPETPHNLQQLQKIFLEPFPKLTPKGHVVCYSKFLDSSAENYDFCTHLKLFDMRLHAWLQQRGCVEGSEMIIDMQDSTWAICQKISIIQARKALGYLLQSFPIKLKALHIIHPTVFLKTILVVFYPLLPKELQNVIQIHSRIETLFDVLPKYCIPNELGGSGGRTEELHRRYIETIRKNRNYFIEDEAMKSDESKRIKEGFFQRLRL